MIKKKLGDLLLERGYVTPAHLEEALKEQLISGKRVGLVLVDKGYITDEQLVEVVSDRLNIPKVSLKQMVIDPSVVQEVPVELARRYTLIPIFRVGKNLTIAMADPLNIIALDDIKYHSGMTVRRAIATPSEIVEAINDYYSVADSLKEIIGLRGDEPQTTSPASGVEIESESESPVIKLVNLIISKAVRERASDIHIEPEENRIRIRNRVNGIMREEAAPPKSLQNELLSRIKIAANLDVSEKRLPQDGRFMMTVDDATVDLRVSTLPTIWGEKIVIRLLDRRNLLLSFSDLGFSPKNEEAWQNVIRKPEGLVLITGPTSSGKTSTLYATLSEINSIEKNIITIEDPVEYSLPLIIQVQINEKAGLTFPSTLRAILRQNPDTIMIGEIRDKETAQMAIRSALTGHLVLSTIHTNDAPSAITRLTDMGIEPYLVASSLKGILAQRLVRMNCPHCSEPYTPAKNLLKRAGLIELVDEIKFKHGVGCSECKRTGFQGLTGIYEFVEITPHLAEMITNGCSDSEIKNEARRDSYVPLFEMGLEKLAAGVVNLEELLKETSNIEATGHRPDQMTRTTIHASTV